MEKLSLVLWRERDLLETLYCRLEVERLVLSGGHIRWLLKASGDVEVTLEEIRRTEILRAVAADEAAAAVGLEPNPSLAHLIDRADEPWCSILADHRAAFDAARAQVAWAAEANRTLISAVARGAGFGGPTRVVHQGLLEFLR